MKNAVGREIPEEILKATGKEVFHGVHYYDGYEYQKDGTENPLRGEFRWQLNW